VKSPVTDVPRCTSSNAQTLGLKHLKLSDVASRSGPPDGARIIHHWTDELPEEQNTVPNGEATPPVQEGPAHPAFERRSSLPGRCETTRSAVFQGSPPR
jgi:hypothetical protein